MILGKELKTIWILWLLLVNPTPGEAKPPVAEKHQRSFSASGQPHIRTVRGTHHLGHTIEESTGRI
jgi:hypothetical protein